MARFIGPNFDRLQDGQNVEKFLVYRGSGFGEQIRNAVIAEGYRSNDLGPLSSHYTWGQKVTLFAKSATCGAVAGC